MRYGQQQLVFLNGLFLALLLGIYGEDLLHVSLGALAVGMAGFFFLSLFLLVRESSRTWLAFLLLFLFFGAWRFAWGEALPADDVSHWIGRETFVEGVLVEAPHVRETAHGTFVRYTVEAKRMRLAGGEQAASGALYVSEMRENAGELPEIGAEITAFGTLKGIYGYGNPGRIDVERAAAVKGVRARLSAKKPGIRWEAGETHPVLRWSERVRAAYRSSMESVMPKEDAAAIFAMLFGGYEGIKPELVEAFTATGIVHILSVSGSHITLLAAVMAWIGALLRLRPAVTAVFVAVVIVFYCVLAGCVPPALRAGAMGLLAFFALAWERESDARRLLALVGMALLFFEPLLAFDVSFQLSFAATAGLLYLAPPFAERLSALRFLPRFVVLSLAVTLGAQLATLPLLSWYFHRLSLSSLAANILVVPVVELIIVVGLFAGLLSFVLPFLAKAVFFADSLLLGLVYECTRLLAHVPGGEVYLPTLSVPLALAYFAMLAVFVQSEERRKIVLAWCSGRRKAIFAVLLLCVSAVALWQFSRPQEMAVHFIDVGQGDAALVVTPHGRALMIDTGGTRDGGYDIGARVDVPYLLHYGVRRLDYIILTHVHEDHAGGAGGILRRMPVGMVLTAHEPRTEYARVLREPLAAPEMQHLAPAEAGEHIDLDGVAVDILYAPQLEGGAAEGATGNEYSNVIRVRYGAASFLFTGDLVAEQEKAMLAEGKNPQCTVLKVAHHGSKTSTTEEFLAAAEPRFAVISVGRDNNFGHPAPEVVERLQKNGIKIYRTDEEGAVVCRTDGKTLRIETFR